MKVKGNGEKCEIGESWWDCEMGTDVSCTSRKSKCYDISLKSKVQLQQIRSNKCLPTCLNQVVETQKIRGKSVEARRL